jgi:hypothetical protein
MLIPPHDRTDASSSARDLNKLGAAIAFCTRTDCTMPFERPFFANLPQANARVAVVRLCDATSLLCAIPTLRALRAAAPNAHVSLIGLPSAAELAQRFKSYIDEFIDSSRLDRVSESFDIALELQAPLADQELHPITARLAAN